MKQPLARVLLLDAASRKARTAARCLKEDGFQVIGASSTPSLLSSTCRAFAKISTCPPSTSQSFVKWLITFLRSAQADVLLAVSDSTIEVVQKHRDIIGKYTKVALPPVDCWMKANDKFEVCQCASKIGIYAPKTILLPSGKHISSIELPSVPAIMKPRFGWGRKGVFKVASSKDVSRIVSSVEQDYLLQEYIPGSGWGACFLIDNNGRSVLEFGFKRLLEWPPEGGPSALRTANFPTALLSAGRHLLNHINFRGLAMVEFRRSPSGKFYIMEVNPRIWGSIDLAVACGFRFPSALVSLVLGLPLEHVLSAPRRKKTRAWLPGLIAHILARPRSVFTVIDLLTLTDDSLCIPIPFSIFGYIADTLVRRLHARAKE